MKIAFVMFASPFCVRLICLPAVYHRPVLNMPDDIRMVTTLQSISNRRIWADDQARYVDGDTAIA